MGLYLTFIWPLLLNIRSKLGGSVSVVTVYIQPERRGFDDDRKVSGSSTSVVIKYGLGDQDCITISSQVLQLA
jgi:hypothetical protein